MQCAAYNKLDTGVHGLSHVVVGHIGLVVHNNVQHDMRGLTAWLPVCVCVCVNHLARLSGLLMWLIKVVNSSVHCHDCDHNHNHYHNHDQHKLSSEQLSNHVFFYVSN